MTITTIDRIDQYYARKAARQPRRSTDRREYVHFCECGQSINYAHADDFEAVCPTCSVNDYDYKVFRYFGDPDEYERADTHERDIIGVFAASAFAVLAAALIALLFI